MAGLMEIYMRMIEKRNPTASPELKQALLDASAPAIVQALERDLFGSTVPVKAKGKYTTNPCIAAYGTTEGKKCKTCKLLYVHQMSNRFYKCRLRKFSHGPATDHKVNWPACGKYEEEV